MNNKGRNYHVVMCKCGSWSDLSAPYQQPVGCVVSSSVFAGEYELDYKSDFTPVCAGPQMPPEQRCECCKLREYFSAAVPSVWHVHQWLRLFRSADRCESSASGKRLVKKKKNFISVISSNCTDNY